MNTEMTSLRAEAAHYVMLCRISPSLRHKLVGTLQPIGLSAAVAQMQLTAVTPSIVSVSGAIAKVQNQTRTAITSSVGILTWLTGEESTNVDVEEGLNRCIELIETDCSMRGVTITSYASTTGILVSRRALRIAVTAVILSLVDMPLGPSRIEVLAVVSGNKVEVNFNLDFTPRADVLLAVNELRPLECDDVHALAAREGVEFSYEGNPPQCVCRFDVVTSENRTTSERLAVNTSRPT